MNNKAIKAIKRLKTLAQECSNVGNHTTDINLSTEYFSMADAYEYAIKVVATEFKIPMDDVESI